MHSAEQNIRGGETSYRRIKSRGCPLLPPIASLPMPSDHCRLTLPAGALLTVFILFSTGCIGTPAPGEKQARERTERLGALLQTPARSLPVLTSQSPLHEYMRYAVLRHPAVKAAYFEWRGSVALITKARSLPDPQLTFEADISDTLMTFMPGVMFDFMSRGKRWAMAREEAASSEVFYQIYVTEVLKTAAAVRNAWVELDYVEDALRLRRGSAQAVSQAAAVEESNFTTAGGMASLEAQVLFVNQAAQIQSTLAALEDRRSSARIRFKSALGLRWDEPDPAWPELPLGATALPAEAELWRAIEAGSPELARMRAMVEMAVAAVQSSQKTRTPISLSARW